VLDLEWSAEHRSAGLKVRFTSRAMLGAPVEPVMIQDQ
jgi:hypothetical protein